MQNLADVTGFLHRVYGSIAETLPDVRDGALEESEIQELTTDPYIKARPRKFFRSVPLREHNLEPRYLPPGTMKEYWVQYVQQSQLAKPASFPCFWRVTWPL